MDKHFLLKEHRRALLVSIIIFLSLLYPVSAYSGYYIFTNNTNKINGALLVTITPGLYTDAKGTQDAITYSPHTPYGSIQDSSNASLFAIDANFTKIPPFSTYGYANNSAPNGPFVYIGTLVQFNLTVDLTLRDNSYIIKQFSDTILLNNETTKLSVKKVITWQPLVPGPLDLMNISSQKTYSLQEKIIETYHMINSSHPDSKGIIGGQPTNFYLKWINTNAVFAIYTTIVTFTALVVASFYISNEYRKYSKIKDFKVSFITYLRNRDFNFSKKKRQQ